MGQVFAIEDARRRKEDEQRQASTADPSPPETPEASGSSKENRLRNARRFETRPVAPYAAHKVVEDVSISLNGFAVWTLRKGEWLLVKGTHAYLGSKGKWYNLGAFETKVRRDNALKSPALRPAHLPDHWEQRSDV